MILIFLYKNIIVYFYLVSALKQRLILELRDYFQEHVIYSKIVNHIQSKFVFEERPQAGIVVSHSSTSKVVLAADDFIGTVNSHVMLANVGAPVTPIEWVREDNRVLAELRTFPTPSGVYFLEVLEAPTRQQEPGRYIIDPLLTVFDEPVITFETGIEVSASLAKPPVLKTVRLYLNRVYLLPSTAYAIDPQGQITFLQRFMPGDRITAEYRHVAPSIGPNCFYWNQSDQTTLPGVIMAFGKRAKKGDKVAIVVYPDRVPTANAYGGKNELQFDLSIFVNNDIAQCEEITDLVYMFLNVVKRADFATEGIEIAEASMGGEAEDAYDEVADTNYYTSNISLTLRADWEIHFPLPFTISKLTQEQNYITAPLVYSEKFFFPFRNNDYERIK